MSIIKVNVNINGCFRGNREISINNRIGQFVKLIIQELDDYEFIDLFNTKIYYENNELDHSKTFEHYSDFQYKKTEFYVLNIELKYLKKRKNNLLLLDNNEISKSLPVDIPKHIRKVNNSEIQNQSQSDNDEIVELLKTIDSKINIILKHLSKNSP